MEQYIKKSALLAKIKSIENETNYEPFTDEVLGKRKVCKEIKDFIDTLETTEVDLKKEIASYIQDNTCNGYFRADIYDVAEYFFELVLNAKKGE